MHKTYLGRKSSEGIEHSMQSIVRMTPAHIKELGDAM